MKEKEKYKKSIGITNVKKKPKTLLSFFQKRNDTVSNNDTSDSNTNNLNQVNTIHNNDINNSSNSLSQLNNSTTSNIPAINNITSTVSDNKIKNTTSNMNKTLKICPNTNCGRYYETLKITNSNIIVCYCNENICYTCSMILPKTHFNHFCDRSSCNHASCGKCPYFTKISNTTATKRANILSIQKVEKVINNTVTTTNLDIDTTSTTSSTSNIVSKPNNKTVLIINETYWVRSILVPGCSEHAIRVINLNDDATIEVKWLSTNTKQTLNINEYEFKSMNAITRKRKTIDRYQ
jgi:hypothetical protein